MTQELPEPANDDSDCATPAMAPCDFELFEVRRRGYPRPLISVIDNSVWEQDLEAEAEDGEVEREFLEWEPISTAQFDDAYSDVAHFWPESIPLDDRELMEDGRTELPTVAQGWSNVSEHIWNSDLKEDYADLCGVVNFALFLSVWTIGQKDGVAQVANDDKLKARVLDYLQTRKNCTWVK